MQAKKRITFDLTHIKKRNGRESCEQLERTPTLTIALVYHALNEICEGPFTFMSIEGEMVVIQIGLRRNAFLSPSVNHFTSNLTKNGGPTLVAISSCVHLCVESVTVSPRKNSLTYGSEERLGKSPRVYSAFTRMLSSSDTFINSVSDEMKRIIKNGTYRVMRQKNLNTQYLVFGSIFIEKIKHTSSVV